MNISFVVEASCFDSFLQAKARKEMLADLDFTVVDTTLSWQTKWM